jgi:hypothetical protein
MVIFAIRIYMWYAGVGFGPNGDMGNTLLIFSKKVYLPNELVFF